MKRLIWLIILVVVHATAFAEPPICSSNTATNSFADLVKLKNYLDKVADSSDVFWKMHKEHLQGVLPVVKKKNKELLQKDRSLACINWYKAFYAKQETLFSVFFGSFYEPKNFMYIDSLNRESLTSIATQPCEPFRFLCGFKSRPGDTPQSIILEKEIEAPWNPKVKKKVAIQINNSSSSMDPFKVNESTEYDQLNLMTANFNKLNNDLSKAKALFFMGHSRQGLGISFSNYAHSFLINQFTDAILEAATNESSKKSVEDSLQVCSHLGCSSQKHFGAKLRAAAPESLLILSNRSTQIESAQKVIIASLDSLLGGVCPEDLSYIQEFTAGIPGPNGSGSLTTNRNEQTFVIESK